MEVCAVQQKSFCEAFNILYRSAREALNIYQKENFFRLLFKDVYALADDGLYDNDSIRKITSGNSTIHLKAMKKLHTYEGFEVFRRNVEIKLLPYLSDKKAVLLQLESLCQKDALVPEEIKRGLICASDDNTIYQESKAIAAILDCLNYSDYMKAKGKKVFVDVAYIRLSADKPLAQYPKYITESPDSAVEVLIGRDNDLKQVADGILFGDGKMLVSAVGGLGKTELIKKLLEITLNTEVEKTGIEVIAWIPYNNSDLRTSMKDALRLQCDLEDVWMAVQEKAADYGERMLLIVDNIESLEDKYLGKLVNLKCRVLVTSRQRSIPGFKNVLDLEPLKMDKCRSLFYRHYKFPERDNNLVNDIILLTAKLTIMIVFVAKVASLEEMTLHEVYKSLVERGFKLSDEDVSCEHEKLRNDETIIQQMCILFSLIKYSDEDKRILTNISVIPNLQFDFTKAKKWFGVKKNSSLMKLFQMGMLEQITNNRKHIYWMHSVIAAAVREQQKECLYDLSKSYVDILSEELDLSVTSGKEYEKAYLIPFSWSVADIMENHWHSEDDTDFLTNLFHICFACSNYYLCEKLIEKIIEIQRNPANHFSVLELSYSYRNKIDLLLQFDHADEAADLLKEAEQLFDDNNIFDESRNIFNFLYGILYQIRADYPKSREYFQKCIDMALSEEEENMDDLATAYANMGRMLIDAGEYFEAYDYVKKAIEVDKNDDNASKIISYCTLAGICSELVAIGYWQYYDEANASFKRVIRFRERNLGKHHADTAVAYHDYSQFLLTLGKVDKAYLNKALKYNEMANEIETELFAEHSITKMRNLGTKALILDAMGKEQEAFSTYEYIIKTTEEMSDDYLTDLACFIYNYGQAQRDRGMIDEAIPYYLRSINIWKSLSDYGNRNLAQAYMGYGECQYIKGNIADAIDSFELAAEYVKEDFYLKISLWDSIASLNFMIGSNEQGLKWFLKLLKVMTEQKVYDESKFEFCENLSNVLEAKEPHEKEIKALILEQVKNDSDVLEYIDVFFKKVKKNRTISITD